MKAGVLQESEHFGIQEWSLPVPGDHEVLIRIHVCGVCMSEVGSWKLGPNQPGFPDENVLDWERNHATPRSRQYPLLMGHEPSGEVVELGKHVTHLKVGQRVVALGGRSFAEYGVYDARYVQPIQESTPYIYALGEPLACAFNAARRTAVQPGEKVVLIGAGFMGLLLLQMMRLADPAVLVAIDVRDDALEVARQVGADVTINSATQDVIDELHAVLGPKGADVVVEAVGKQPGLDLASRIVGFNGRITIYGFHQDEPRSIDMALWNWKGLTIINGHERYQHVYFNGMVGGINLLEAGQLDMARLVTHQYSLSQIDEAFHDAARKPPGFIKAVVEPVAG